MADDERKQILHQLGAKLQEAEKSESYKIAPIRCRNCVGGQIISYGMKRIVLVIFLAALSFPVLARGRGGMARRIDSILKGIDGVAGVSVVCDGGEIYGHYSDSLFPMLSVFKLHQAVAVLDSLDNVGGSIAEAEACIARISEVVYISMRRSRCMRDLSRPKCDFLCGFG